MTIWIALFLGAVQGLTEFLPVSSSAHLEIFPWLFHWNMSVDDYDLALHAGTLLAILIYFFKDWINLICGGYKIVAKKEKSTEGRIFWYLVVATIPAGVLGILLEKGVDKLLAPYPNGNMIVIAVALIALGIVLYIVDKRAKSMIKLDRLTFKQGFLIGISQALAAAFPGTSRSGITMTTARAFGVERESAARYSFLLSAPIIAGGVLVKLLDGFHFSAALVAGILASFAVGMLVIHFLMGFLKKGSFKCFAIYRMAFGVLIMIVALTRVF